ncbi:MAG TPA: NepR family anti-sigma factor [Xanthobacteraceae bacterium]|nr:NepR family anti-sigma factor [Xanthobacteraceae bacterium]
MQKHEWGPADRNASIGRDIQAKIGDQLRAMYEDVVSQGVPDRFADLLRRLEQQDEGERS